MIVVVTMTEGAKSPINFTYQLTNSCSANPAEKAFNEAVELFKTQFTEDECKRIWLRDKHSMVDVQAAVYDTQRRYNTSKKSKARKWLKKLSSRVALYGLVLDVLVQHHPEYISLVWGAFKFLFIVQSFVFDFFCWEYEDYTYCFAQLRAFKTRRILLRSSRKDYARLRTPYLEPSSGCCSIPQKI